VGAAAWAREGEIAGVRAVLAADGRAVHGELAGDRHGLRRGHVEAVGVGAGGDRLAGGDGDAEGRLGALLVALRRVLEVVGAGVDRLGEGGVAVAADALRARRAWDVVGAAAWAREGEIAGVRAVLATDSRAVHGELARDG